MKIFCWNDKKTWPKWLNNQDLYLSSEDNHDAKVYQFVSEYGSIKAYHGCRTTDLASYYNKGIIWRAKSELIKELQASLLEHHSIIIPDSEIIKILRDETKYTREIFTFLDSNALRHRRTSHYCLYGSEFLTGAIQKLKLNKELLTQFGTPSILEVNIPISLISKPDLNFLITEINNSFEDKQQESFHSFRHDNNISPSCMVAHINLTTEYLKRNSVHYPMDYKQ